MTTTMSCFLRLPVDAVRGWVLILMGHNGSLVARRRDALASLLRDLRRPEFGRRDVPPCGCLDQNGRYGTTQLVFEPVEFLPC